MELFPKLIWSIVIEQREIVMVFKGPMIGLSQQSADALEAEYGLTSDWCLFGKE